MVRLRRHRDMHSTMRAYDGLAFETTHSCIRRIAQRNRGGGSENRLTKASSGDLANLSANEIVSANEIESIVDS